MKKNTTYSVFCNASALVVLQLANYVLPFILIPYLTRVLGVHIYGVVAFGLAIGQISCIITDYGFLLSGTYIISRQRDDEEYVGQIVGAIFLCKIFLLCIVALLIVSYALINVKYEEYTIFLILMLLPVIGQTFQPLWFFQGIEKMTYITAFTVVSRALYLFLVLLLVTGPTDYYLIPVANGGGQIIAAIIGIWLMVRMGYRPVWPKWSLVRSTLSQSTAFFWSRAAAATYTAGGAFFLGLLSTPIQVAYYSAAEQLYRGGQALMGPLAQALYPHMVKHRNFPLFFRILRWITLLCLLGVGAGLFLGPWLIKLIFGSQFEASYSVLVLFLAALAVNTPSVLLGYPFLGAMGQIAAANRSVMYGGAVQVLLLGMCYLFQWYAAVQVAVTVLVVEAYVLVLRAQWGWKYYETGPLHSICGY